MAGHILKISDRYIEVRDHKTRRSIKVRIAPNQTAYSAYGGDEKVANLPSKTPVRIWYKNCGIDKSGRTVAAYIEFFSTDPKVSHRQTTSCVKVSEIRNIERSA